MEHMYFKSAAIKDYVEQGCVKLKKKQNAVVENQTSSTVSCCFAHLN